MSLSPSTHPEQPLESSSRVEASWFNRPLSSLISFNWDTLIFSVILILAMISRFYNLGARVMSHDENSHVYFSWLFEQGNGYSHDPVTHGPLQFHLIALSYFLLGDNDFSARVPAALFSVATIAFMWRYRRLLGRSGALIAAALYLISPYMLYYGRYARNEAFVGLFGVMTLWAILRYLESGEKRYLFWLTAAIVLHFTSKETAFIYTAQALLFLAGYLVYRLLQQEWPAPAMRNRFLLALMAALLLLGTAGATMILNKNAPGPSSMQTISPAVPGQTPLSPAPGIGTALPLLIAILGGLALLAGVYFLVSGYSWSRLRNERAFDLLILIGTLVLPLLAAFPVKLLGFNPIDYQSTRTIYIDAFFVILFAAIAVAVGLIWNARLWLANAGLFYAIFTVFYTSVFTNGFGFMTGLVGSLGYWLEQQGVNRGSQPWYYYALLQMPFYEFLPYLGTFLALIFAPRLIKASPEAHEEDTSLAPDAPIEDAHPATTIALFLFWSFTSLLAYTIAGEKMPWLTVHITLPMILCTAWFLGKLIETSDWSFLHANPIEGRDNRWRVGVTLLLIPVFVTSLWAVFKSLFGNNPPFQGKELTQLQATSTFLFALITAGLSGWGLEHLMRNWPGRPFIHPGKAWLRLITLGIFAFLGVLTVHSAVLAAFINYDYATEFLVYAHSAPGVKEALKQIEEISRRTTDGLALRVAYDSETTYPYWWYLRNYTNKDFYGKEPTRALREDVVILVGEENFNKIEPVVGQAYYRFDYIRLWWPNQDYFGLTWERIRNALSNPDMRQALFDIWLKRDYSLYGTLTNKDMSTPNWYPSAKMRMYIRKDVVASLWNYGVAAPPQAVVADPYEGKQIKISADAVIGTFGSQPGQFQQPRDLVVAPDGSLYVADTGNHRIQHLAPDGSVLQVWGSYAASSAAGEAPGGTFNEPWGIALGPDGSVYVADTWNNRIQKFDASGNFITAWGFGISQSDDPYGFYGPRDVAITPDGKVLVTDTGNKRVLVYDADGKFLTKFGGAGMNPGEFDEPVGLAVDANGLVYVADTWNQRIQVFSLAADGSYQPVNAWEVAAWYGQSVDNKPYLAVDNAGHLFAVDPEGNRVLEFTTQGEFLRFWGDYSTGLDGFDLAGAVAVDNKGGVWVSDTHNGRIMHFSLP